MTAVWESVNSSGMKRLFTLLGLLVLCGLAWPTSAANLEAQNYHRAFMLIDSGHALEAEVFSHGHDPVLNRVIRSLVMEQPGNDISFEEMADFIANNPDWPNLKGIVAIAEQKLPANMTSGQVINWFTAHPPVSLVGFYHDIDIMNVSGMTQNVPALIRARWIDGDFTPEELTAFHARFIQTLGDDEILARLDRLLWKNDAAAARQLYPYIDAGRKALAEARLALASRSTNVVALIEHVPGNLQSDPGLLYEYLRWYVRSNQDDQALVILNHAPEELGKPEAWWEERQIMARRLVDKKDYDGAYRIAANHGHLDVKHLAEAEFLSGWLALRFLNQPEEARDHFQLLFDNAATPISRARGAYWLGRTYESVGNKDMAEQSYETAAALNITYYGQLAAARVYSNPTVSAAPEPAIPQPIRNAFYARDLIRAVERLYAMGERDRAHSYFHAATEYAQQRSDFALLTELAYRIERPDFAIEAGKAASQKNILMASGGFPLLGRSIPQPPDPRLYACVDPAGKHVQSRGA